MTSLRSLYHRMQTYLALARKHRVPLGTAFRRRRYYRSWVAPQSVPLHPLHFLPDGFCVRRVADTGLRVVDNFCTPEEAAALVDHSRGLLEPSMMVVDHNRIRTNRRTSETATVFSDAIQSPLVLPLLYRGAMLTGLPYNHVEAVYVTRYKTGAKFETHTDFYPGFEGDRLYTILIYLNDLTADKGGATVFENLNVAAQPKLGRAVAWTNKNPDGSVHEETRHEAMPVLGDAEKWVIQLWFRRYKMFDEPSLSDHATPQTATGKPVGDGENLPDGVTVVSDVASKV